MNFLNYRGGSQGSNYTAVQCACIYNKVETVSISKALIDMLYFALHVRCICTTIELLIDDWSCSVLNIALQVTDAPAQLFRDMHTHTHKIHIKDSHTHTHTHMTYRIF